MTEYCTLTVGYILHNILNYSTIISFLANLISSVMISVLASSVVDLDSR